MTEVRIRPMLPDDVRSAEQISDDAFHELDLRTLPRDWPAPERRAPEHSARWISRPLRLLENDPGGCWVGEDATGVLGFATSPSVPACRAGASARAGWRPRRASATGGPTTSP